MLIINRFVKSAMEAFHLPIVVIAFVNIAIALIAFIKDIALAAYAGTSLQADALTLAFFIPDGISNNMFAAAISVVCVPGFSRLAAKGQFGLLRKSINHSSVRFLVVSVMLMSIIYLYSGRLVDWLNGSSNLQLEKAILPLLHLLLPTIVLFVLIAIGTAVLQSLQRFIIPAVTPLIYNLFFLAGVLYCSLLGIAVEKGVIWIVTAITIGVSIMAIWIAITWYKATPRKHISADLEPSLPKELLSKEWVDMLRIFVPYIVILFSIQAVYFAERYLVTSFDSGTAAALNYAFRLTQLPIWVFVSAVSIIILPSLSKHLALGRREEANSVMTNAFRGVILIVLPSMLFLFLLREPLVTALFQRGAFDVHSVQLTSSLLEGYSLSVLSQAVSLVCLRYFLAERGLAAVLAVYSSTALMTILLDIWLTQVMGPSGIGYGAALGALLNAMLLLYLLRRHVRPSWNSIMAELRRYRYACAVVLVFFPISRAVWFWMPVHSTTIALVFILLSGCCFLLSYLYILRRYWPGLFASINFQWGR